jgi:hypothetical protein
VEGIAQKRARNMTLCDACVLERKHFMVVGNGGGSDGGDGGGGGESSG